MPGCAASARSGGVSAARDHVENARRQARHRSPAGRAGSRIAATAPAASTSVLPAARIGTARISTLAVGKLHGVIAPTTPRGPAPRPRSARRVPGSGWHGSRSATAPLRDQRSGVGDRPADLERLQPGQLLDFFGDARAPSEQQRRVAAADPPLTRVGTPIACWPRRRPPPPRRLRRIRPRCHRSPD